MRGNFTPFMSKSFQIRNLLFLLLSQGFRIFKNFGHLTSGKGGKKTFKRYLKSEQTNTWTHGHTYRNFNF